MQLNTGRYLEVFALTTIVFCGTIQYFTGVAAVLWLPFFMVLVMVVLLMMQAGRSRWRLARARRWCWRCI